MTRVTVIIVTWHSSQDLPQSLSALRRQTFSDYALHVVDNASTDGSVGVVRKEFKEATIVENASNEGFCRAVNQGLKLSDRQYVLLLNADVTMEPECLAKLVAFADTHPMAGSVCPKLLRPGAGEPTEHGRPFAAPVIIDAAGISIGRSRVGANRGEGESDRGQYSQPAPVFGCSGACVLYRRCALQDVAVEGEFFDEDFFAYKDDVDIAWRLQLAGYEAWYTPSAVAYHVRRVRRTTAGWNGRIRQRRKIAPALRAQSLKNQYLMLVKNEQGGNFVRDLVPIIGRTLGVFMVSLAWEPFLWRALPSLLRQLPAAWRKRRIIQSRAKARPAEMRQWFTSKVPNSKHPAPNS